MEIHPSQRRISCEVCRRNKTKCKKVDPNEPCERCASLGVFCDPGQQRKVGRPKGKTLAGSTKDNNSNRTVHVHQSAGAGVGAGPHRRVIEATAGGPPKKRRAIAPPDTTTTSTSHNGQHQLALQLDVNNMYQRSSSWTPLELTSQQHSAPAGFRVPPWPTFMTDAWYGSMYPNGMSYRRPSPAGAFGGMIPTDLDSSWRIGFPPSFNVVESLLPNVSQASLLLPSPLKQNLAPKYSGVRSVKTYYVHENRFSSHTERVVPDVADLADVMPQLMRIKRGLQLRRTIIALNRQDLILDMLIYSRGPLFLENSTVCTFLLESSQDLLQLLHGIHYHQQRRDRRDDERIASLIAVAIDVFCQQLSFLELTVELMTAKLERLTDPLVPIPGVMLDGVPVVGLSAQGALFCNTSLTLLKRFDPLLGIGSESGEAILSATHFDMLWDRLDQGLSMTSSNEVTRPEDMQKLLQQLIAVLERAASAVQG